MAAALIAPRLALIGILFSTLLAFHECSEFGRIAEQGNGDEVKSFLNPLKCFKHILKLTPQRAVWCCALKLGAKICYKSLRFCLRHCHRRSSPPPPYAPPK